VFEWQLDKSTHDAGSGCIDKATVYVITYVSNRTIGLPAASTAEREEMGETDKKADLATKDMVIGSK